MAIKKIKVDMGDKCTHCGTHTQPIFIVGSLGTNTEKHSVTALCEECLIVEVEENDMCDECEDPIELDSAWWINDRRICEECLERNLKANPRIKFIYG